MSWCSLMRTAVVFCFLAVTTVAVSGAAAGGRLVLGEGAPQGAKAPRVRGLDSALSHVVTSEEPVELARRLGFKSRDGRIQVVAIVQPGLEAVMAEWLSDGGARWVSSARERVQAHVTLGLLEELRLQPGVMMVRRPLYARPAPSFRMVESDVAPGGFTTEALGAMNVAEWHGAGYTGEGIRIGVIDGQFGGYEALLGSELPAASDVQFQTFGSVQLDPSKVHGTGCAEIIHDIAPDAELYLALFDSLSDWVNALDWLGSQGVDVVSTSMSWSCTGPGDGTGYLQDEHTRAVGQYGYVCANSAGNYRDQHWQGQTTDTDNDGWVNFSGSMEVMTLTNRNGEDKTFDPGDVVTVYIIWDDWDTMSRDHALCLYDISGDSPQQVHCQNDAQSGGQWDWPTEFLSFEIETTGQYGVAIWCGDLEGENDVELFTGFESHYPPSSLRMPYGSISQPSDAESVLGVAAIDFQSPFSYHSYSSKGPNNAPGGGLWGSVIKPDISGYAGVSTSTYGSQDFYGTSAACPHVAGAAALVREAYPTWSVEEVTSYLEAQAEDLGDGGKDNDYGHGRLVLGTPPAGCETPDVPTGLTADPPSPGSGEMYSVSWSNVSDADSYELQESTSASFTGASSYEQSGTSRSLSHGVSEPITYYYRVRSKRDCGSASGWSTTLSVSVGSTCDPPTVPSGLSADPASPGSGEMYSVSWSNVSDADSYELQESTSASFTGASSYEQSGTSRSLSHGVSEPTTYYYRVRSERDCGANSAWSGTLTVTVGSGGEEHRYLVAGIAHAGGAGGTAWRSTLSVCNVSESAAQVDLRYRYDGGSVSRSRLVQPTSLLGWDDVAVQLFGVSGASSGSVEVTSEVPLTVAARTFNQSADGTYGQFLPGVEVASLLAPEGMGLLQQLRSTSEFRTNIGFVNYDSRAAEVGVRLFDADGQQLGVSLTASVPGLRWCQLDRVFELAGANPCDMGYAIVIVDTTGARVWAYASVVDNATGDPTTIPLVVQ